MYRAITGSLKAEIFELSQKDDLGTKYSSIKVNLDQYIKQGLITETLKDGNTRFYFKISVVA